MTRSTGILLAAALLVSFSPISAQDDTGHAVLRGFTEFPFDTDLDAIDTARALTGPHSNLYAVHLDQCLPWMEAVDGRPLPEWLAARLLHARSRVPAGHAVYVAMTPTAMDRRSLAPTCGAVEGEELPSPKGLDLNSFYIRLAYLNYVRQVVDILQPDYVNLGIEISELALVSPESWRGFSRLYSYTRLGLKDSHPNIQVGVEMVLQTLLRDDINQLVRRVVEESDYLGISFYPYGSEVGELEGKPALPAGPDQWRVPLAWLRSYTTKPIAICETGYTTGSDDIQVSRNISIPFSGDKERQRQFLRDLIDTAKNDRYLFVVWFIAVDYDRLLEKLFGASELQKIWVNTGLFDSNLNPKPAWEEWLKW